MITKTLALLLAGTLLGSPFAFAQDKEPEKEPEKKAKEKTEKKPPTPIIDAADKEALSAGAGKRAFVKGTVESIKGVEEEETVQIDFEGGNFRVMIDPNDYKKEKKWLFTDGVGKELFVKGTLDKDGEISQMWVGKASAFGLNRAAFNPKKAAPKEEEKKYEPVSPGAIFPINPGAKDLKPGTDSAVAKVLVPRYGTGVGSGVEMVVTEVTVEIGEEEEAGPMQAGFELKPKAGIEPMIATMTYLPKKYKEQGWPRNKVAHFVLDELQSDSAPPNFAAAVMIEALLQGFEIPDNVVLYGGMRTDGRLSRSADKKRAEGSYLNAIELTASAALPPVEEDDEDEDERRRPRETTKPKPEKSMILITGGVPNGVLDDLVLDQNWETLNSTIVISCEKVDEAVDIIRGIAEEDAVGKSILELAVAQKVLRERTIRMLANDQVWSRVVGAGKTLKQKNATAFAYARMKAKKTAKTYSLDRCLSHIHHQVERGTSKLDKMESRELRKFMREIDNEMKLVQRLLHPEAAAVYAAAEDYMDEAADHNAELKKVGKDGEPSERIVTKYKAAKTAYSEARSAATKLLSEQK